ncbi:unnamed protein product [Sphagnum balticum]
MSDVVTLSAQLSPMPSQSKERSLFNLPPQAEGQTTTKEAGENPFASPGSGTKETSAHGRQEEDPSDGWIFKAKKRGSTRLFQGWKPPKLPPPLPKGLPPQGTREAPCTLTWIHPSSKQLVFQLHQEENHSELGSGRF